MAQNKANNKATNKAQNSASNTTNNAYGNTTSNSVSNNTRSVSVCRKTWPSTEKNSLRVMRTRREFRINLVFRLCILQSLENGEKAVFKPAVKR